MTYSPKLEKLIADHDEAIEQLLEEARRRGAILIASDDPIESMALKFGFCLLWDKPLLVTVNHGEQIPQALIDAADEVVWREGVER